MEGEESFYSPHNGNFESATETVVTSHIRSCNGTKNDVNQSFMCTNTSEVFHIPKELQFNDENLLAVLSYTCMFVVAACGNLTVFITLFRNRHIKSRVNQFILHLSIADLIVTFIMLPLEIIWNITVEWTAGDAVCRILMFFRILGLYLSSFILVTISLDRYFAIVHPLSLNDADKRGKIMLILAWTLSVVASIPQSVIFHVEAHPDHRWFTQCVTFNFFPTDGHELAYNLFNLITLYALPLVIITASYSLILWEITKRTRQSKEETQGITSRNRYQLRRSGIGSIERARTRTLKMTLVIVSVFIVCWTPYFVISTWWWFAKDSAKELDRKIQRGLFLFAVSNSCMDPLVYGMFTINFKREFVRCCCCMKSSWRRQKLRRLTGTSATSSLKGGQILANNSDKVTLKSSLLKKGSGKRHVTTEEPTPEIRRACIPSSSSSSSHSGHSVDRANVNNFMKIKIRDMPEIMTTS